MENHQSLQGKIVLVTGSSRGIGLYTAQGLAKLGAHVIITSQDRTRCEKAAQLIREETHEEAVSHYVLNLASQDEIHNFSDQLYKDYDRIDVLVNNVGGWFRKYQQSPDGIEMTFALNHLSYFLLTGKLLDLLRKSAAARIVNVSSDAHRAVNGIRFDDLNPDKTIKAFSAYAQSKLANIMFTYELAARLEDSGITANVLHPGFVASELYRNFGMLTPLVKFLAKLTGKSSEEGALTSIYLSSSPEVAGVTGKYFVNNEQMRSSDASYDPASWTRLWEMSEVMTNFKYKF